MNIIIEEDNLETNLEPNNSHLLIPLPINLILDTKQESKKRNDECVELKNIKYKSMCLKGTNTFQINNKIYSSAENIDIFLENEKAKNSGENWMKISKGEKLKLMKDFAKKYIIDNNLDEKYENNLIIFFKECIDQKKLNKSKDVKYDKINKIILDVNGLILNSNRKFTIKNGSKSASSSLTPKKKVSNNSTIKFKNKDEDEDEDEDENGKEEEIFVKPSHI